MFLKYSQKILGIELTVGMRYMILSAFGFSIMAVCVKFASGQGIPVLEIVAARAFISLLLSYIDVRRKGISLLGHKKLLLLSRGSVGALALMCVYYAITHMPLAEATVLQYLHPMFTAILALMFLKERIHVSVLLSIVFSFIGLLFIAGILPGLLGVILYLVAVLVTVTLKPEKGPRGERFSWPQRLQALWGVLGVLSLFLLVIGGIYSGIFTPTEAAGIGASGAFFIALVRRRLTWHSLFDTLIESSRTTAMLFVILIGAEIFSNYVNIAGLPELLSGWVVSFDLSAIAVIILIMLVYVLLGTVLESLSMIMLTVPVFYPLVLGLDLGAYSASLMDPEMTLIWFGIIVVVITEISLITPPVGLNVFVLKSMLDDVKLSTIFRGVTPFWVVDIIRLMALIMLPGLVLWLPKLMAN